MTTNNYFHVYCTQFGSAYSFQCKILEGTTLEKLIESIRSDLTKGDDYYQETVGKEIFFQQSGEYGLFKYFADELIISHFFGPCNEELDIDDHAKVMEFFTGKESQFKPINDEIDQKHHAYLAERDQSSSDNLLDITWEIVQDNPDKPWDYDCLSGNSNVTWKMISQSPSDIN